MDCKLRRCMKRHRRKLFLAISLLLTGLVLALAALNGHEKREGMLDTLVWEQTGDTTYEMQCFQLGFEAGKYSMIIAYDSASDIQYRLVDEQHNDGENHLGKEIISGTLPGGEPQLGMEFVLKESSDKLTLYVEGTDHTARMGYWIINAEERFVQDFVLLFLCAAAAIIMIFTVKDWNSKKYQSAVIICALILTVPFLTGILQSGDDLEFHLARIRGLAYSIESGQFPVRLNAGFASGYGFSVSMMYPELFLYIPALLYICGVSLLTSYKFLILCVNIGAACISFYSFKRLLRSERLGMIVSLLYLLNPYRLINIFHRAAVGEMLAQIFLPLLLYGIYELVFGDHKKWWLSVIAATGILQSHILSVEMSLFFVVLIVAAGVLCNGKRGALLRLVSMGKAVLTATALNLWFLIPFADHFGDNNRIQEQMTDMQASAVDLYDLFRIAVKLQGPYVVQGVKRQEFITIGFVLLAGMIVYIYYAAVKKSLDQKLCRIGNACLILGIFSCYLSTRFFPWNYIKENAEWLYDAAGIIQFPWRFLGYAALFLVIPAGIAAEELLKERKEAVAAVLAGLSVFMAVSCMDQYAVKDIYLAGRTDIKPYNWATFDYYASDTDGTAIRTQGDTILADGEISITDYERNGVELSFDFSGVKDMCKLRLPVYDYGMHEITLNREELEAAPSENHQVMISLTGEQASGHIEVKYRERILYKAGTAVSAVTVVVLIVIYIQKRRRKSNGKRKSVACSSLLQ